MNDVLEELKDNLSININQLHVAAKEQAFLAELAGEITADKKAIAKRAKMEYERMTAETTKAVMDKPENYGLAKTTESAIKAAVTSHTDVIHARTEQIVAEQEADEASAVYDAYNHRKSMIQVETQLFSSNYWGDVYKDEMENAAKATTRQLHDDVAKMRKKKHAEKN